MMTSVFSSRVRSVSSPLAVLLAVLVVAGCGGSKEPSADSTKPAASASASPTAPVDDLKTACPKVNAAIPKHLLVPTADQIATFRADVKQIAAKADSQTSALLAQLDTGVGTAASAYDGKKKPKAAQVAARVAATKQFFTSVQAFADQCTAAGSKAFK